MASRALSNASRPALRGLQRSSICALRPMALARNFPAASTLAMARSWPHAPFSTSPIPRKGIMPDSADPSKNAVVSEVPRTQVELSEDEYHAIADSYLDYLVSVFEDLQDETEGVDVEFSAGVLTVTFPEKGTYVINKQPPNKQIWLSSPISGPKRYDWFVIGDSQNEKEGTAGGNWVYARSNSTLDELFLEELGIDLSMPPSHQ